MSAAPRRILVAGNSEAGRYAIAHVLRDAGFETMEASTGNEALNLARQSPLLVILDVKLPGINGYDVCRRVKSNPLTSHIPVLELSEAFDRSESKLKALDSGADSYLAQPAEPVVLVATVNSLLRMEKGEALAQLAAKQWQASFDALSEGVGILDCGAVVQRSNLALSSMLGKSHHEIEGRSLSDLALETFGVSLKTQGAIRAREVRLGSRYFQLCVNPIDDAVEPGTGHCGRGGVLTLVDVTACKQAEHAVVLSERLAATGRLAHTIAHEINNPLEAVTNLLYLLTQSLDDENATRGYLRTAQRELDRVSRISRQILAFNRDTDKPVPIELTELLESVLSLNGQALEAKKIEIQRDWDRSFNVEGFPAPLQQVFSNLLRNAIDASKPGSRIVVRISRTRRAPEKPAIRTTIADSGAGIPREVLPRIFDPFFTTKGLKGSGVGLWLSSAIVDRHGGRIQVRSRTQAPSTGACFSVLLLAGARAPNA